VPVYAGDVAVVNIQVVIENSKLRQELLGPIITERNSTVQELSSTERELFRRSEELMKNIPAEDMGTREVEFEQLRQQYLAKREYYRSVLEPKYKRGIANFNTYVDKVIRSVAKSNGYDLVISVDKTAAVMLYSIDVDITQKVIYALDNNHNKEATNGTKE
jgi:Skp family chaperone for outer membrane proteins